MGVILEGVAFIAYIYFGDKANQFCKRNILHLETAYVFNIGQWLLWRFGLGLFLGWITIPIALLLLLFGVRD